MYLYCITFVVGSTSYDCAIKVRGPEQINGLYCVCGRSSAPRIRHTRFLGS